MASRVPFTVTCLATWVSCGAGCGVEERVSKAVEAGRHAGGDGTFDASEGGLPVQSRDASIPRETSVPSAPSYPPAPSYGCDPAGDASIIDAAVSDASRLADVSTPSDATPPSDAGAPPPDCVPPCVWELVKDCLPSGPCVYERGAVLSVGELGLMCTETGSWTNAWVTTRRGTSNDDIYVDGNLCFNLYTQWNLGSDFSNLLTWNDANGSDVAHAWYRSGNGYERVQCANSDEWLSVDPSAPHCEPWRSAVDAAYGRFNCSPGCCPGEPPAPPPGVT